MPNKYKKEMLKNLQEQHPEKSNEDILQLHKEIEESEMNIHQWHTRLFPEEYDFHYDSIQDAVNRAKGLNPMSKEYIDKVNKRRKELGFGNYIIGENNNETYQFVVTKINSGKESDLEEIIKKYNLS